MGNPDKSPVDRVLDVFLFAPLGLALNAKEELPALADRGRVRVEQQVTMARMVGQFALSFGQKEVEKAAVRLVEQASTLASRLGGFPGAPGPTAGAADVPAPSPFAASAPSNGNGHRVGPRPTADNLAIPGYDTLSASQVVQRLAGLTGSELDEVRRYEEASRGRRTILSKIAQLQGDDAG